MTLTYSIKANRNRIHITYSLKRQKQRTVKWFAELTKKDYLRGLGWNQWGATVENLCRSVELTERLTQDWVENLELM